MNSYPYQQHGALSFSRWNTSLSLKHQRDRPYEAPASAHGIYRDLGHSQRVHVSSWRKRVVAGKKSGMLQHKLSTWMIGSGLMYHPSTWACSPCLWDIYHPWKRDMGSFNLSQPQSSKISDKSMSFYKVPYGTFTFQLSWRFHHIQSVNIAYMDGYLGGVRPKKPIWTFQNTSQMTRVTLWECFVFYCREVVSMFKVICWRLFVYFLLSTGGILHFYEICCWNFSNHWYANRGKVLHHWNLTWTPENTISWRGHVFHPTFFRSYIAFPGCTCLFWEALTYPLCKQRYPLPRWFKREFCIIFLQGS